MNSKPKLVALLITAGWLAVERPAYAQLNIAGADGSDGELATPPRSATLFIQTIDLSQAVTGNWDDNNAANAGKGIYDPVKWAVVFKYSSVNIRTNTMIKFKNHPSHAPVIWLVSGDVVVAGTLDLSASAKSDTEPFGEPGPGGFRGAYYGQNFGFGPGAPLVLGIVGVYSQGYEAFGQRNDSVYGNSQIIPLIGGSGGSSQNGIQSFGGGGGGAILVASRTSVTIDGSITASGFGKEFVAWNGSSGAVRVLTSELTGKGVISAAFLGRIRLEALTYQGNLTSEPNTTVVLPDSPPLIWPRATAPEARIISVAGKNAPAEPLASLDLPSADINFQDDQPVDIVVETKNLDVAAALVNVRITPRNGAAKLVKAVYDSGTAAEARWVATTIIPQGFAVFQVRAVGP